MSSEVEVTYKVPRGRTLTVAGKQVTDGQKGKVSPKLKEQLAKLGHIVQTSKPPKGVRKDKDEE